MCVGECLADDAVDDPYRLGRESAALAVEAAVDEQLRVERVEVFGLRLLQLDLLIRGLMWFSMLFLYDAYVDGRSWAYFVGSQRSTR